MSVPTIPLSSNYFVTLPALLDCPVSVLAKASGLGVDQFLADVERWAAGAGLPYGVRVDREAQMVTQDSP